MEFVLPRLFFIAEQIILKSIYLVYLYSIFFLIMMRIKAFRLSYDVVQGLAKHRPLTNLFFKEIDTN